MADGPHNIERNPAVQPPLAPNQPQRTQEPQRTSDGKTFGDVLRTKVSEQMPAPTRESGGQAGDGVATTDGARNDSSITWSSHALARLKHRNIALTEAQTGRLETAFDRLAGKGANMALVLLDQTAMVVSAKNRTVITAIDRDQARENVFTNIDSALIA
jgi:flagellar operon protein